MSVDKDDASCLTHAQQHTHGVAASAKPSVAARSRVHETAPVVLISAGAAGRHLLLSLVKKDFFLQSAFHVLCCAWGGVGSDAER